MPEVVSDTSPLQYLYQAEHLDLLPALYREIIVPEGVSEEIAAGRCLGHSLPDLAALDWIRIEPAPHRRILLLSTDLGKGEREVLSLVADRPGAVALLDDGLARRMAARLGIAFTGTLGVLLRAKAAGHVDAVAPIVDRLESLGFRLAAMTRAAILELAGET
jgi:predicted nucleic acid-binding protein